MTVIRKTKTDKEALAWAMVASAVAHQAQVDYHGRSYLQHLIWVAGSLETEEQMVVALLHDMLEDTPVNVSELYVADLSTRIINAVVALTKTGEDEDYFATYIPRVIESGELAVRVKLADLSNNLREDRRHPKSEVSRSKYKQAVEMLNNWLEANNKLKVNVTTS